MKTPNKPSRIDQALALQDVLAAMRHLDYHSLFWLNTTPEAREKATTAFDALTELLLVLQAQLKQATERHPT